MCSVLPRLLHVRAWRGETLAAAASTGLVSWALTALSFGLACKHITLGNRGRRLRTLEAFIAILTLTQLLYLILLHTGSLGSSMTLGLSRRNCDDDEELRCDEIPREELYTNKKPAIVAGA